MLMLCQFGANGMTFMKTKGYAKSQNLWLNTTSSRESGCANKCYQQFKEDSRCTTFMFDADTQECVLANFAEWELKPEADTQSFEQDIHMGYQHHLGNIYLYTPLMFSLENVNENRLPYCK